mgnify:FL=1|tara:strand:+ start:411 stop:617 length:207 start_codon:yes stop_codon:yes gene_type:complete
MIRINRNDKIVYQVNNRKIKAKVAHIDSVIPTMAHVLRWNNQKQDYTGSNIRGTTLISINDIIQNNGQ